MVGEQLGIDDKLKKRRWGRVKSRNIYKGHMDKIKGEGGSKGERWVWLVWGDEGGAKQTTVIEQQ